MDDSYKHNLFRSITPAYIKNSGKLNKIYEKSYLKAISRSIGKETRFFRLWKLT